MTKADELRDISIIPDFLEEPTGSVLVSFGKTRVLCTVMVENTVPPWLMKDGEAKHGWITATYNMLPGSGNTRIKRERKGPRGRTHEIERLIGRSLRASVDLKKLGANTLWVDCDVLQADGGTRTASITGAWVALKKSVENILSEGVIEEDPMIRQVAAVSVGLVKGKCTLDLCYQEDSNADVDMNVVMDSVGNLIEVQATAEENVFTRKQHDDLLNMAEKGIMRLIDIQSSIVGP
jgi:ribonuclease PH